MKLSDYEKSMLDGKEGDAVRMSMEILVALGEIYDAEKLIEINSAHVAGLSLKSHGIAGMEWVEDLARSGAKVKIPTTLNVIGEDRTKHIGFPGDWSEHQLRIGKAYENLGCFGTSSCVPYYLGFTPRFGQHIAWAESSAIVYVNSVLAARTNREGGPSALAAALTGRTPYYGLHIKNNRYGQICYHITTDLSGVADYGALGAYIGKRVKTLIPIISGIKRTPTKEELVYFGAALASSGSVALYHIVGVTPEAPTLEIAAGLNNYETITIGKKELEQGYSQLNSGQDNAIDFVAIGCPHCSLEQLAEIAELIKNKKVSPNITLWIHTNVVIRTLATQLGYIQTIENAGGRVTQDLCVVLSIPESLGLKRLATNSPKMAFYAPGGNGLPTFYGSVKQCINAAVSGLWQ